MVFKKKVIQMNTDIMEAKETDIKKNQELDNEIRQFVKEYLKYSVAFKPEDVANMAIIIKETEILNMNFAIFCQLKKLNDNIIKLIDIASK